MDFKNKIYSSKEIFKNIVSTIQYNTVWDSMFETNVNNFHAGHILQRHNTIFVSIVKKHSKPGHL